MGQKINPIGLRIGIVKTWNSKWFAEKGYPKQLHEDLRIRKFIKQKLFDAGISKVLIERAGAAVARAALDLLGGGDGRTVNVVAGKGNNGADGRVAGDDVREPASVGRGGE